MAKIVAVAEKPTPIRPEAHYTLGRDGNRVHVLMQAGKQHVTLCPPRKATKVDKTIHSKDDINCGKCKNALARDLEATG